MIQTEQPVLTIEDYKPLLIAYNKAVKQGKESFMYKDAEVLTKYAMYLLEYMQPKTKKK